MALKVNIATVADYNSIGGRTAAPTAATETSGGRVVEQNSIISGRHTRQHPDFRRDEAALCSFIATAPHAIAVTDAGGIIQMWNPAAESMLGYCEDEVSGTAIEALFDPSFGSFPGAKSTFCCGPLPAMGELKARKKTGELVPVEAVAKQAQLGRQRIYLHYIRDVSPRQRFEQRISELQQELLHLSQQNVLGELASAITHELNQPLTAITNYAAAAKRCGCAASPEELKSSFALMDKAAGQAKRAWQIVHKLRSLVQHHGADCEKGDLRTAVEDAIQLASLGTSHQGITISVSLPAAPVTVLMDRVQIQILLTNLVRNGVDELRAVKGERKIRVALRARPGEEAEVSVEDTGRGLTPEVFESIFDPFHTTKPDGLGMGLAISRRIAEAHGGRLAAANRPEGGAVFTFVIPMSNENMGE
jgi:two-component system, LuxR family, sensor kinase FixL